MDQRLAAALAITAATTAVLAVALGLVKLVHRQIQRYRSVRAAYYIAAVGEMLSRGIVPAHPRDGWARDPLFHDALADYRLLVTGDDRRFIDEMVERLGIADRLVKRARRRFPLAPRLLAVSTLVNLASDRHRDDLRRLVHDPNSHVRVNAVRGLARLEDVESIPFVLDLATRVDEWEAARIADGLLDMGTGAVEPIRRWIEHEMLRPHPSVPVTALAARLLGLLGDPDSESTLLVLLESPRPVWRIAAASALEHTGSDASVEPLRAALGDDDWRVRARAAVALGAMAEPSVARDVAALLKDRQWWVRQNAAAALGRLPGGNRVLFAVLKSDDPYAVDAALNQLAMSGALADESATADPAPA